MSLYLDTSCLLKLFFPERESARVAALVAAEERVVISTLAHLELRVQVQGRVAGGTLPARSATALMAVIDRTLDRLHLATMEALGLRRLLTNDETQARAAAARGFEVLRPR